MSLNFYCEEDEERNKEESINKYAYIFTAYDKKPPSFSESLTQMFSSLKLDKKKINDLVEEIISKCKERIDPKFNEIKEKYENITKEDAYIICSYTFESEYQVYSPYKILNQNLVSDDRKNGVRNVSKYLYIFLKSLRKLPRHYPKNKYLYRCLTRQVNISTEQNKKNLATYVAGSKKTFWGFTSTSADPRLTYSFLNKEENIKTGTIFVLKGDIWGYDIELFNYFHEKEILLEPERKILIDNVLPPLNGVINITCTILESNLILNGNEKESNIISFNKIEESKSIEDLNLGKYLVKFEIEAKINEEKKYTSGFGILCDIPYKNIKILLTYNHFLNFDFLNEGKKMILYINKEEKEININITRYKYTNENLDISIIEILESDNLKNFIEIDKFIQSRNYIGANIISVFLNENGDFEYSYSKVLEKNDENYNCSIETRSEGLILSKDNTLNFVIILKNFRARPFF